MRRAELLRLILEHVEPEACVFWPGARSNGYPKVAVDGSIVYAHRWIYEAAHGPIPEGHDVHHVCHQRACVNPHHLEVKTRKEHLNHHGLSGRALANALKTHCPAGHPLKPVHRGRGCRVCHRVQAREWARRKAAARRVSA